MTKMVVEILMMTVIKTVDTYSVFMKASYYSKYFHYILSHSILIISIGEGPCYYLHFTVVETEA